VPVRHMDNPVAMINVDAQQNETWYYYFTDALGSVRLLSDAGGVVKESYTYDVFGQPRVMRASGTDGNWLTEDVTTYIASKYSIGNPYMFAARRWDDDVKLYYYRFRDYAPKLGRFVQTDPAGYIDTMNLYAYCGNNPVNWIDPWGLKNDDGKRGFWEKVWYTVGGWIPIIGPGIRAGMDNKNKEKELFENADKIGSSDDFAQDYLEARKKNWGVGVKEVERLGKAVRDDAVNRAVGMVSEELGKAKDVIDKAKDVKEAVEPDEEDSGKGGCP